MHLARIALVVVAVAALAACDKKKEGGSPSAGNVQAYEVRGVVKAIAHDGSEVTIHHEAIPTFIDRQGETSPMMSMSMPFGVDDGVDLSSVAVGDKISFTFDVDWERADTPTRIQKVEKLSADTQLEISGH